MQIGRSSVNDVLHVDVSMAGCGATHGFHLSLFSEWIGDKDPDGKMVAYLMHQTGHMRDDSFKIIFRPIFEVDGRSTKDVYIYLVFEKSYGYTKGPCANASVTAQTKLTHNYLPNNDLFIPGLQDEDFQCDAYDPTNNKYTEAKIIDLANIDNMYTKDEVDAQIQAAVRAIQAATDPKCLKSATGARFEAQPSSGACMVAGSSGGGGGGGAGPVVGGIVGGLVAVGLCAAAYMLFARKQKSGLAHYTAAATHDDDEAMIELEDK